MNAHLGIVIMSGIIAVIVSWGINAATPVIFIMAMVGLEAMWWVMKPCGHALRVTVVEEE